MVGLWRGAFSLVVGTVISSTVVAGTLALAAPGASAGPVGARAPRAAPGRPAPCSLVSPAALASYFGTPSVPASSLSNDVHGTVANCEWTSSSDQLAVFVFKRSTRALLSYFGPGAKPQRLVIGKHPAASTWTGGIDGAAQVTVADGRVYELANSVPSSGDLTSLEVVTRMLVATVDH